MRTHCFHHRWIPPDGHDTGIKVYNCIVNAKVPLVVQNKNCTTWYSCGPTVYDSSHIGHACCYVKLDILQRILRNHFDINLVSVMNITDIDDKIIKRSLQDKCSVASVAKHYEQEFWTDLAALKVSMPNVVLRVTEHMPVIIDFIEALERNGNAYKARDNSVYFNLAGYSYNYGKLQNIAQATADSADDLKRSSQDFALWKAMKSDEPFWESPWGRGRPGWHVECSALATLSLGSTVDIHVGGLDLRFPHHENEEAQSCAYHGKHQWVNYWLHTGLLRRSDDDKDKMSKSLQNTITIQELLATTNADVFRMACVMSHYRNHMEYSTQFMNTAASVLNLYKNFIRTVDDFKLGVFKPDLNNDVLYSALQRAVEHVHLALCDDFDTPTVMKTLNELISTTNLMLHTSPSNTRVHHLQAGELHCVTAIANFVVNTLGSFEIRIQPDASATSATSGGDSQQQNFVEVMQILNDFRQSVRQLGIASKNRDMLSLCDDVRNSLGKCGIVVKDHGKRSTWSK